MSTFEWLRKKKEEEERRERRERIDSLRAEETGDCVGCRREKV